jgi:hypothetical protein
MGQWLLTAPLKIMSMISGLRLKVWNWNEKPKVEQFSSHRNIEPIWTSEQALIRLREPMHCVVWSIKLLPSTTVMKWGNHNMFPAVPDAAFSTNQRFFRLWLDLHKRKHNGKWKRMNSHALQWTYIYKALTMTRTLKTRDHVRSQIAKDPWLVNHTIPCEFCD